MEQFLLNEETLFSVYYIWSSPGHQRSFIKEVNDCTLALEFNLQDAICVSYRHSLSKQTKIS